MKNKFLVSINKLEDIDIYKKVGITTFVFALKNYSIGYENSFSIEEINSIDANKYCLINRLLTSKEIDDLIKLLPSINVNGFIIEDIGLIDSIKKLNKEVYLFINHFNCNYASINEWLNYVDSVFISNELTFDEIKDIAKYVKKPVIVHVFGYNQLMYSRRYLLTNYYKHYNLPYKNSVVIKDKAGSIKMHLIEDEHGTISLSNKIFNGKRLLNLNNILYFYLNTSYIPITIVLDFLNGKDIENSDEGLLDIPTIFKLGGHDD